MWCIWCMWCLSGGWTSASVVLIERTDSDGGGASGDHFCQAWRSMSEPFGQARVKSGTGCISDCARHVFLPCETYPLHHKDMFESRMEPWRSKASVGLPDGRRRQVRSSSRFRNNAGRVSLNRLCRRHSFLSSICTVLCTVLYSNNFQSSPAIAPAN
jgi:hypothetical protein